MSLVTQHGIFGQPTKHIKMYKDSFVAVDGSLIVGKLSGCGFKVEYEQVSVVQVLVPKNAQNVTVFAPNSNGQASVFVAVTAEYNKDSEYNYLSWRFSDDATFTRDFTKMLMFTGRDENPVPALYVTNPDPDYAVVLNVMVANVSSDDTVAAENDYDVVISSLSFSALRTIDLGETLGVYNNSNNLMLTMNIESGNISNVELADNNFLVIDDASQGTIGLQFTTEYDQIQALSALTWLLSSPNTRTLPQAADTTAPVISFTGDVIANVATDQALIDYAGEFEAADAITLCIDSLADDRDGTMSTSGITVEFVQGSAVYDQVTVAGTYIIRFSVRDTARNQTVENVQITLT